MSERLIGCSTDRTGLTCVGRVDKDSLLTNFFSLIFDKSLKLPERPSTEFFVKSPTEFLVFSDREFFKDKCITFTVYNGSTYLVINVSNETVFSSAYFFEQSFCRTSASLLEFPTQIEKLSLSPFQMFGSKKCIVRTNGNLVDTTVDAENLGSLVFKLLVFNFNNKFAQEKFISLNKNHAFDSPINIFLEMLWNRKLEFFSAFDRAYTDNPVFEFGGVSPCVISDSSIDSLVGFVFVKSSSLENITCLVSGTLDKRTLKGRICFAEKPVRLFMQFVLVKSLDFPTNVDAVLNSSIEDFSSFIETFVIRKFQAYGSLHTISLELNIFKPYGIYIGMQKLSSATYEINYHFVWCTKYRKPYLKNIEKDVKNIIETICQTKGWIIKELRVMPEHIRLFISTPPYESPTGIVKVLKGTSAIRIFKQFPETRKQFRKGHIWSPGYYVGTAGHVSAEVIEKYIQEQSLNSSSQRVRRSP